LNGASAGDFFDAPDSGATWAGARQSDSRHEPPEKQAAFFVTGASGGFLQQQG